MFSGEILGVLYKLERKNISDCAYLFQRCKNIKLARSISKIEVKNTKEIKPKG
jgi:hypothetical protein